MAYSRFQKDGQQPKGHNTGDKAEGMQDVLSVTSTEKIILLAALQYYRLLPQNRQDSAVEALCTRLELVTDLTDARLTRQR